MNGECYYDGLDISKLRVAYTKRESLNLQSLIFVQWTNYATLYLSFIVHQASKRNDPRCQLFPERTDDIQEECRKQMTRLWNAFPSQWHLTIDERNQLVSHCLQNMYQVKCCHAN